MLLDAVAVFVSRYGRVALVLLIAALATAGFAQDPPPGTITQENFSDLATQILTYLGYAIVAGLTVLVAVIGARRAWSFMRRFL
jgi:Tfp pilus assembly protein PilW